MADDEVRTLPEAPSVEELRSMLQELTAENAEVRRRANQRLMQALSSTKLVFGLEGEGPWGDPIRAALTGMRPDVDAYWVRLIALLAAKGSDIIDSLPSQMLLERMGPAGAAVVKALADLLSDRNLDFCATKALASMGRAADAAVPALCERALARGVDHIPFHVGKAIACLTSDPVACAVQLARRLDVAGPHEAVEGIGGVLRELGPSAASALPLLAASLDAPGTPENIAWVLSTGAVLARQAAVEGEKFLTAARRLQSSESHDVRGACAAVLGMLGRGDEDRAALIRLARDPEPAVRMNCASCAADFASPDAALVDAVASLLGDFEASDGEPHLQALEAIVEWGAVGAAAARPHVARWLEQLADEGADDGWDLKQACALAEAVGEHAASMLPPLRRLLARYGGEDPEGDFVVRMTAVIGRFEQR